MSLANPTSLLTCVTLTGVDDHTDLTELVALSRWAPRVEWGVLYSPSRSGKGGRYPAVKRAKAILAALGEEGIGSAVHLCGAGVNGALLGQDDDALELAHLAGRVQLNFNQNRQPVDLGLVDSLADHLGKPVITQYNRANADVHLILSSPYHQVLFDASGGRGTRPEAWPAPLDGKRCGYAGGLGPASISQDLQFIATAAGEHPFWVDMETLLRDPDDRFDLKACSQVLTSVHQWIAAGG